MTHSVLLWRNREHGWKGRLACGYNVSTVLEPGSVDTDANIDTTKVLHALLLPGQL